MIGQIIIFERCGMLMKKKQKLKKRRFSAWNSSSERLITKKSGNHRQGHSFRFFLGILKSVKIVIILV